MHTEDSIPETPEGQEIGTSEVTGFSVNHMDLSKDPLTDFASYSFGTWARTHPIPADKVSWGTFVELSERNMDSLHSILESCLINANGDPLRLQLGSFYASAMDTSTIDSLGFRPLEPMLKVASGWSDRGGLVDALATLHLNAVFPFFRISSAPDEKNSTVYALRLDQGGLSLPDRDYYLEPEFAEIMESYRAHITRMLILKGQKPDEAALRATRIIALETALAKGSRSRTELRDAERNYNRIEKGDLDPRFPELNLGRYLGLIGLPDVEYLIVGQPEYLSSLEKILAEFSLDDVRNYMQWQVICDAAPYLFREAEEESFDFFSRKIMGREKQEPRWKRAVRIVDGCLGESLGKLYVEKYFGPEARTEMGVMVDDIREVFAERLKSLSWMGEETKKRALAKFYRFRAKIGHPEKFRDYSSVRIDRRDFLGNVSRSWKFETERQIKRVGKPVDRNEWYMTPPTVNAYFSPPENEIVFPAGILQPPFFQVGGDIAVNYGAIGAVISHEITHGYDDQGRKYDELGNLNDWWTPDDAGNFKKLSAEIVDQYSALEVLPGLHVNGELTLGENIADFGGVSIAFEALRRRLARNPELNKVVDGLTAEQRFFVAWAQVWKANERDQYIRMLVTVDPHAPPRFRASIPVYNHPAFHDLFNGSSAESNSVRNSRRVSIW